MSMLADYLSAAQLRAALLPRADWQPYPTAADRAYWTGLPAEVRQAYVAAGEGAQSEPWPLIPATRLLDFARNGNRCDYEKYHFDRRSRVAALALAECVEGKGRFVDELVNGLWATLEESYWGLPAHLGMQRAGAGLPDIAEPTVDLFAAETGALVAWVHYLLRPALHAISPLLPRRCELEVQRRILTPCLARDDFWWSGFVARGRPVNNWNPWINSNWLAAALLLEGDETRRLAAVQKCLRSLDHFVKDYPPDGGCDEGPGYWGRAAASLFDCLVLLRSATSGAHDVFGEPLIGEMGRYIYRLHVGESWFVNFADASALAAPEGGLVFRFGEAIGDAPMRDFSAWLHHRHWAAGANVKPRIYSLGRALADLAAWSRLPATAAPPLPACSWLPGLQVLAVRDQAGSTAGLFLAAKGGHNAESHNHNDVGHFVIFVDGCPLLVDAGVEVYTRKTFSAERYDIWTMQSAWHNLPTVNGVQQSPGRDFAARDVVYGETPDGSQLAMELAGAYPAAAGVVSWRRTLTLERGKAISVHDEYRLAQATAPLRLHLLSVSPVTLAPGQLRYAAIDLPGGRRSAAGVVCFSAAWAATTDEQAIDDPQVGHVWGKRLYRVTLTLAKPPLSGSSALRITPA